MIEAKPGTISVFSDIGCPWASAALERLVATRARLDLVGRVEIDHHAFPLELINGQATPRPILDAEIPVVGALVPEAGWQVWQGAAWEWPVTMLPALEAVQAAKAQSLEASTALDLALRRAFYAESRCISLRPVILEVAGACCEVEAGALAEALDDGRARRAVIDDFERSTSDDVRGSPHLFLADGTDAHNPGITYHWQGRRGHGFPVVDDDDPSIYEDLLRRAAT